MFAVVKTGGKQYRVAKDDIIVVEKLNAEAGDMVALDEVLMIGGDGATKVGTPMIEGASVHAEVLDEAKGDKIIVFKKKRRQTYRRTKGHRQWETTLKITDIYAEGGKKPAKKAKKAEPAPKAEKAAAEAPAEAAAPAKTEAPKEAPADAPAAELQGVAPEVLSGPRDGKADDLKKIGGVGPKLEEKLNGLGIYHYDQIASFTPENVAYVDETLNFKGRIDRDDWIGQAKALAEGKE